MYKIQFDVDVDFGADIDVANDVLPILWMEVYPFRLSNQNHCNIPKLNDLCIPSKYHHNHLHCILILYVS